jgi:hypothetical protein
MGSAMSWLMKLSNAQLAELHKAHAHFQEKFSTHRDTCSRRVAESRGFATLPMCDCGFAEAVVELRELEKRLQGKK